MSEPEEIPFDDLKMQFGQSLELIFQADGQDAIAPSTVLGFLPGESLIVGPDPETGCLPVFQEGQRLVVRVYTPEGIGVFTTTVLFISEIPTLMAYLDFAPMAKFSRVRGSPRAVIAQPIIGTNVDNPDICFVAGKTLDLSVGGAKIVMTEPLGQRGQKIELRTKVKLSADFEQTITLVGRLCEVSISEKSSFVYGVQFNDLEDSALSTLTGLVYKALYEGTCVRVS